MEEVFSKEIEALEKCARPAPDNGRGLTLEWGTEHCFPKGASSDISKYFVARGVYEAQIRAYLRHFRRDQLLILPQESLLKRPAETLRRVFEHVWLPPYDVDFVTDDMVSDILSATWPGFEQATGWRLHSRYAPLPEAWRERLANFYRPFNRALYQLVGEDFGWVSD